MSRQLCPHAVREAAHDVAHAPAMHTAPAGHAVPQAPQFAGSRCRSAQRAAPPSGWHIVAPAGQVSAQRPISQRSPAAQTLPQAPQCSWSLRSETH